MSKDFYQNLPAFSEFEQFTHAEGYQPLPEDWVVVVADIKNSTTAIEEGQYKEVNLIGAASITQTMQSQHTQNIPFVFGGDGASICVHQKDAVHVARRLAMLQKMAMNNFGLELRVAMIPVSEIRARNKDVLVAKLEITQGKFIALFRGGGLAEADSIAKSDTQFETAMTDQNLDSLEGLSCRWSPVPSKKGKIVSLLVMARDAEAMDIYRDLLEQLRQILGCNIADVNPIKNNLQRYKSIVQASREEARYHRSWFSFSFLSRFLEIIFSVLVFKYGINPVAHLFKAGEYKNSISSHSDFRKFDDTLRLVMDCSVEAMDNIHQLLEQGFSEGHLFYGLHASDQALMTCFLETAEQGDHLHFIDGGDGGLAMAARQIKSQMSNKT